MKYVISELNKMWQHLTANPDMWFKIVLTCHNLIYFKTCFISHSRKFTSGRKALEYTEMVVDSNGVHLFPK